jgi:6-phosphofructokinase 1
MKRIAILCSGGDSQGMNTAIKIIVNMSSIYGIEVVGINRGYQGLLEQDMFVLKNQHVENIANLGGCYLKVARSKEFETKEGVLKAKKVLVDNDIDSVIIIGGNGSYRGALELINHGVKVIALPGTIDNDLFYTERTLGFDTAVNNAVRAIDDIRQTMEANNRTVVVEVMGRECGDIALNVAVAVQAHSVGLKETNKTINDIVDDVHKVLKSKVTQSPIVVISEAVEYSVEDVQKQLTEQLGIETRGMDLSYLLRGGAPSVMDRTFATQLGILAIELIKSNKYNLALGIKNNRMFAMDLKEAINVKRSLNYELLNQLRDMYRLN